MFFPNTLQTARETQKHEFHLCLNRRRRRDGALASLGGPAGAQRWRATDSDRPVRRSPFFELLPLRVALDAGRETSIICGVRSLCIFAQSRIVDGWGHAPNGLDQCPNGRKALIPDLRSRTSMRRADQAATIQARRVPLDRRSALNHFLRRRADAKPFTGTADSAKIIAATRCGHQVLVSIH
jgi:hypothetical protein